MSSPTFMSSVQKLHSLLIPKEKMKWTLMIIFALCTSLLEVLTASVIIIFAQILNQPELGQKYLYDVGFTKDYPVENIVLMIALGVGLIYLIKNIIASAEVFFQNFTIQKMNYHFKNKLLKRYAEMDYGFHLTRNSSLYYQVIAGDAEQVFSMGMIALANIISESIVFIGLIAMIIYVKPSLAFLVFGIGLIVWLLITKALFPQFYRWGKSLRDAALQSAQHLTQFFQAFKEIVILGKRDVFVDAYRKHSYKKSKIQAVQTATNALPRIVIETLFLVIFVSTISFLCLEHEKPMQMIGILGGYLYVGFRIMPGLNRIIMQLNNFKSIIPAIEQVYREYHMAPLKETYVNVTNFNFERELHIDHVSFAYINTKRDALKDISFKIKKGECIGIAGETGSGKSTLVDVILGLLRPYQGRIVVDGQYPVNAYQWHQKVGYVPQSIYLLDDTIEANIAFGQHKIDETILNSVIEAAQLRKFIEQLPQKTKTVVGERGVRLSGGERQRIAIARALYCNPEVLIFDEATSALDNETETRLMETIKEICKDRTVIMIAHRITTLKDCHRILVMENGMIRRVVDSIDGLRATAV